MARASPDKGIAALSRTAAQLSRCFRTNVVPAEVAGPLNAVFTEALLLSVAVPSVGLSDELLINVGNFLESDHPKVTLLALSASLAGSCYIDNAAVDHSIPSEQPSGSPRFLDAELAKERCNAEVVLCCPIPMSTAGVLARSSEASSPQDDCLGVISLGLRGVSSSINRYKGELHTLALLLAETIRRDSRDLVRDVCKHQLGGPGPWPPEEPLSSLDLSTSCSTEGGKHSSSGGDPPSGGLPQLVSQPGDAPGPGSAGTDEHSSEAPERQGSQGEGGAQMQPRGGDSQYRQSLQREPHGWDPNQRKGGLEDAHGEQCPPEMDDTAMERTSSLNRARIPAFTAEPGGSTEEGQRKRSEELQVRADMLNTYDAKAAGCTASAFEASREGSSSLGCSDSSTGSSMFSSRSSSSGSSPGSSTGSGSLWCSASPSSGSLFGGGKAPSLADEHSMSSEKLTDDKRDEKQDMGDLQVGKEGTGKLSAKASKTTIVARRPLMSFRDPSLEQAYNVWHARQRWQMDAAGFLFLALLSVYFANPTSPHMPYPWPSAVYATCQHLLPLMIMAGCMPWYLRNRELVLGIYLAVSAVVTVYSPHREASQPESQSALASLVWFSCAQSAEPIMLKGVLFALRFRRTLVVQALCVVVAFSRAPHICSTCCSAFMSPASCLLKAWAAQAVFGCGVPAAVSYFTEEAYRQAYEQRHLHKI